MDAAFPSDDTPPAPSATTLQHQMRTEALLGKEGRSLQFALYSELRSGMQWGFILLCLSCNLYGQPQKVGHYSLQDPRIFSCIGLQHSHISWLAWTLDWDLRLRTPQHQRSNIGAEWSQYTLHFT